MATIDASIPLGIRPAQFRDPLEQYANVLGIQAQQQQNALRAAQAAQAQEQLAYGRRRREQLNALLGSGKQGAELESELLRGGFLEESLKLGKDRREMAKSDAAANKDVAETKLKELDLHIKKGDRVAAALRNAKDQNSWNATIQALAQIEGPEAVQGLPQQYDPNVVQVMLSRTVPELERLKMLQEREKAAETARHNKATEANTRRGQDMTDARERDMPRGTPLDTAQGPVLVNPRTGQATPITVGGKPVASSTKPMTEAQAAANLYGSRMIESDQILNELEGKYSRLPLAARRSAGDNMAGAAINATLSPEAQQVDQAQRDFINAVLRRESGAVITPSEFANANQQYFPQPGDSKEVVAQKARNRKTAIEGMKVGAGPAAPIARQAAPAAPVSGFKYLGKE